MIVHKFKTPLFCYGFLSRFDPGFQNTQRSSKDFSKILPICWEDSHNSHRRFFYDLNSKPLTLRIVTLKNMKTAIRTIEHDPHHSTNSAFMATVQLTAIRINMALLGSPGLSFLGSPSWALLASPGSWWTSGLSWALQRSPGLSLTPRDAPGPSKASLCVPMLRLWTL